MDPARARLDEAERLARRAGNDGDLAAALNIKGVLLCRLERWGEAEAALEEAGAAAERGRDLTALGQSRAYLADLRISQGRWAEALEPIGDAVRRFGEAGSLRLAAPARVARGLVLLELGRAAEAAADEEAGLRELEEQGQGDSEMATRARIYLGRARAAVGDREGARRLLDRAEAEAGAIARAAPVVAEALKPLIEKLRTALR
jgi:tetratricopeptide (TPR) repeat protein